MRRALTRNSSVKTRIKHAMKFAGVVATLCLLPLTSVAFASSADKVYGSIAELQAAKVHYEKLAKKDAWGPIKSSKTLQLGSSGTAPQDLRKRLAAEGYKVKRSGINYDAKLEAVVKEFQRRHGLEPNGKADPGTYAALSITPAERLQQIEANIQRRQEHLERSNGDAGILVNLPEQRLHGFNPSGDHLSMKIAVAKTASETPEMYDRIESVVVNPYWNVPLEIVDAELVWEVNNNPNYLAENDMEIVDGPGQGAQEVSFDKVDWDAIEAEDPNSFPYLIRRKPGSGNPMGLVKFVLPSRDDVYLHGAPGDQGLSQTSGNSSQGCITLENPMELANFISSRAEGWSQADLRTASESGDQRSLRVEPEVGVDVVYWTAWVGADGQLNFRGDLFDRD